MNVKSERKQQWSYVGNKQKTDKLNQKEELVNL